jgi:16S rRNA (guanine(1405)-N(7))-methyltransferase
VSDEELLTRLVEAIQGRREYRGLCTDLVRRIAAREWANRRDFRQALKASRSRLHQIAGAYLEGRPEYGRWLQALRESRGKPEAFRETCRTILARQASTRERLPILDRFYQTLLADLPPLRAVLDLACGLHPLGLPWMALPAGTEYYACDIYQDLVDFLNGFFALGPNPGRAEVRDILHDPPALKADLAWLLKAVPCLDRLDRGGVPRLLDTLEVRYWIISFPVQSLHGKEKGMVRTYEERFRELAAGRPWDVERFLFPTELVFRVTCKT